MESTIEKLDLVTVELEGARQELSSLKLATKYHSTSEQRAQRRYLEELIRGLNGEKFSWEMTIAELQWTGVSK